MITYVLNGRGTQKKNEDYFYIENMSEYIIISSSSSSRRNQATGKIRFGENTHSIDILKDPDNKKLKSTFTNRDSL